MQYGLKNTKYMTVITGRKEQEQIEEEVKEWKIEELDTYCYLGIILIKGGNLKDHMKELKAKQME